MRVFNTLQFRIPTLVLLVGVILIGLGYFRNVRWRVERRLSFVRATAHAEGTKLSGMAQHFFRKNLQRSADLELSYASAAPDLDLGLICDGNNVVRHATRLQWKDVPLDETPLHVVLPWLEEVRRSMSGRVQEDEAGENMLAVFPFGDVAGQSVGIVALSYDLRGPRAEARQFAMHETVAQGMALLSGSLLIWGVIHLLVTRRVHELLAFTRSISAGETPHMPRLGNDELSEVGRGISDAMRIESRLLEAGEQERRRIGRDLHDDVCQRITAAQLRIGVMGAALTSESSPLAKAAGAIETELSDTAQIVRGFARGLAPVALDVQGLDTAFMELAQFLERSFGIQCEVNCEEGTESYDSEVKAHLYRIAQELATNAAKHAKGSFVSILLKEGKTGIRLEVENDGNDFVEINGSGLGWQFIRQRVRALGGRIEIKRRDGGLSGTRVVCDVPGLEITINNEPHSKT